MPSEHEPIKVFYSYAHEDEDLRDDLNKHLSLLRRQGFIAEWHDRCITAGTPWGTEIDQHLEAAQIILLLISPDFLASDYCHDIEMTRALARHDTSQARVIPIILREVFWELSPFGKLQCLPTDAKPVMSWADKDAAFKDIALGIYNVVLERQRTGSTPATPLRATPPPSPHDLRANYLALMATEWRTLRLAPLDPNAADPRARRPVTLDQVYVALDTKTPRDDRGRPTDNTEYSGFAEQAPPLSAVEAVVRSPEGRLVLLGQPGAGKTTFARHLALALAQSLRGSSALKDQLPDWGGQALLPVFVSLSRLAGSLPQDTAAGAAKHVEAFIRQQINSREDLNGYGDPLLDELRHTGGLVIFDGLDEAPGPQRQLVKEAVSAFAALYERCQVLVTCRTHSYRQDAGWRLDWPAVHELAPLRPEQIGAFIDAWYQALSLNDPATDYDPKAAALKTALRPEDFRGLAELAGNPLMLTVMAIVHTWRELPGSRVEVYWEFVDILLLRWHTERTPGAQPRTLIEELQELGVSASKLQRGLLELAYTAHQAGERQRLGGGSRALVSERTVRAVLEDYLGHAGVTWFLAYCQHANGLLLAEGVAHPPDAPREGLRVYAFPHLSLEEYLAALYLRILDIEVAVGLAGDPAWREVIRFLGESLCFGREVDIGRAWNLLEELCPELAPADDADWRRIWLAGELLPAVRREASQRQQRPSLEQRIARRLADLLETASALATAPQDRAAAGRALAAVGDPRPGVGLRADGLPDIVWLPVPAGKIVLKDGAGAFDTPPFHIAKYLVTWAQYRAFLEAPDGYRNPRWWQGLAKRQEQPGKQHWKLDNHPAEGVSWYDAMAYCHWLSAHLSYEVRLPNEWEWQQAATGGNSGNSYPWGKDWQSNRANTLESRLGHTTAVGMYPEGVSPVGALDMAGNVREWSLPPYANAGNTLISGEGLGVVRGGSWADHQFDVRTACRLDLHVSSRLDDVGFRVVCAAPI